MTPPQGSRGGILGRVAALAVVAALVAAFWRLGLAEYLTLAYIKESQASLEAYYEGHRPLVIATYMGIYIAVTALSLPGAVVMTLAGGAVFGLAVGTVAVSFASTIGATLACLVGRFLLRDWVQGRFAGRMAALNEGVQREGAFYLFTLRLVPVFPFFVVNLAMGLTRMPLRTFYWVSQVGMLPGTLVYVNAGRELGRIDSLAGILSPGLLASFVLIGLLPLGARWLVRRMRVGR